jgi:YidC/Oxa1 family membrane protein insertase
MDRRRQVTALLFVSVAFFFFWSDSWHRLVRKMTGQPEPAPVTAIATPLKTSKLQDTGSVRTPVLKGSDSLAQVDSSKRDSGAVASAPARILTVRTGEMVVRLSSAGGRIEGIQLLSVKTRDGRNPWIMPEDRGGALGLKIGETDLSAAPFRIDEPTDSVTVAAGQSRSIVLTWEKGAQKLVRTYTFQGSSDQIGIAFQATGLGEDYQLAWKAGIRQIEPPGPRSPSLLPPSTRSCGRTSTRSPTTATRRPSRSAARPRGWACAASTPWRRCASTARARAMPTSTP